MSKTLESPHLWAPEDSAESNARRVMTAMAREYFERGREMVKAKTPASKLHPFRLATKRFRYTLEMFRDVYGPSMEKKLEMLKPVQDALGDVNDCVATRAEFKAGRKFGTYLDQRADRKAREFYKAWKSEFDTPGQEDAWVRYLSRVPKPRRTRDAGAEQPAVNGHAPAPAF